MRTPDRYISLVDKAWHATSPPASIASITAGEERLPEEERLRERLELALRTREGVPDWSLPPDDLLDRLVVRSSGRAVLSLEGRLLANEVAVRLTMPGGAGCGR